MALASSFLMASAITISRALRRDMGFAPLVANVLPAILALFFVSKTGFQIEAPWWIFLNGFVVIPLSFWCLATGPKYISAPEVAMFYLLETILAPVWVWLIFAEVPSTASLIGGAIMVVALVSHSVWQIARSRRSALARMARRPL
jgi:drug/metabolite transporter (DMT)-like permease